MEFIQKYIAPNLSVPGSDKSVVDFAVAPWIASIVLILRVITEASFLPSLRRKFAKAPSPAKTAYAVLDNLWIGLFASLLDILAWYTTITHNENCTPWSASNCFSTWPNLPNNLFQRWFMVLSFAFYLSEMFGTIMGIGTKLSASMWAHHIVTMILIWISYDINLVHMSVMWQALFDISNPILHFAKACDKANTKALNGLKWFLFNLFALLFLVCRVILGLVSILYPSFVVAVHTLPASWLGICWTLEIVLYALQVFWFYKIVQIALKGDKSNKDD